MKIVFLRHGESMGNVWGGAYADDATNFLSLKGVKQAEIASYDIHDHMPNIDIVYMSELTRARQTAITVMQSMGDWRRRYEVDGRLNEWCWDAKPTEEWYKHEMSTLFWERVNNFYQECILPRWDEDINVLVTSHYYTMFALFQLIRQDLSLDHKAYTMLDPNSHGDIPNSVPFHFDTSTGELPRMLLSGYKNR